MKKRSKRYRENLKLADRSKTYEIPEAISVLKVIKESKFDETVELAFHLLASKKDEVVRGLINLPYGTGKKVRILALTSGEKAKEAKDAGADFVGLRIMEKSRRDGVILTLLLLHPIL